MRVCRLRLDGDPLAVGTLDVFMLLRVSREADFAGISAHLVQVVDGKNQIETIFRLVTGLLGELDADICAAGTGSPEEQRVAQDQPVRQAAYLSESKVRLSYMLVVRFT